MWKDFLVTNFCTVSCTWRHKKTCFGLNVKYAFYWNDLKKICHVFVVRSPNSAYIIDNLSDPQHYTQIILQNA